MRHSVLNASGSPVANTPSISGLHIVANFAVSDLSKLVAFEVFKSFVDQRVASFGLTKVGEVYHNFPGGGYTGVVCLTESHLSVHTWPENNYLTFDIFLSNHLKDNRPITRALYQEIIDFFNASVIFEQSIQR